MKVRHPSPAVRHEAGTDLVAVDTRAREGADVFETLDAENVVLLEEIRRELERFTREIDEAFGPIFDATDLPMLDRQMSPPCVRDGSTTAS